MNNAVTRATTTTARKINMQQFILNARPRVCEEITTWRGKLRTCDLLAVNMRVCAREFECVCLLQKLKKIRIKRRNTSDAQNVFRCVCVCVCYFNFNSARNYGKSEQKFELRIIEKCVLRVCFAGSGKLIHSEVYLYLSLCEMISCCSLFCCNVRNLYAFLIR